MSLLNILIATTCAVILFVFGLEHFSKQIEKISGERFRKFLGSRIKSPIVGVLTGAIVTALIQSSTATSVITVNLVNAGILTFKNSIAIILGSNIGTTITAQLVAFHLTSFAPILIIIGFLLSFLRNKYSIFSKTVFYFGFVFFSLNLISAAIEPLQQDKQFTAQLLSSQSPFLSIIIGTIFTALVHSSSVTTGLAIILAQKGLITLENAIPLIMGANLGTTLTAFFASRVMDIDAKKTATSHVLFNLGGVLICTPLFFLYQKKISNFSQDPSVLLANIHLLFNVITCVVFTLLLNPFSKLIDRFWGKQNIELGPITFPSIEGDENISEINQFLDRELIHLFDIQLENYNLVTLSLETNYKNIYEQIGRRITYVDYLQSDFMNFFSKVIISMRQQRNSTELLRILNRYEYLFQIHDSIKDLYRTKQHMSNNYIDLQTDVLLYIRAISNKTLSAFNHLESSLKEHRTEASLIQSEYQQMQEVLDEVYQGLLKIIIDPSRKDAGVLTHFFTYSKRLNDKLINFGNLGISDS